MINNYLDQIKITPSKGAETDGTLVIEPLPQGFGITLGNSLRRVLLSSLSGGAITQVKFDGIPHEYTTIKGVKEDVVQILLNLKKIRLKIDTEKPVKLSIEQKGPALVTAADIETPPGCEIVNKEAPIATLADSKTKFEASLVAEKGVGFTPASDRREVGIGIIPLDANFSPVLRVFYKVEETRVGQMTNFDKLTLRIVTDGTITPLEGVKLSATNLINFLSLFTQEKLPKARAVSKKAKAKIDINAPIEELDLPTRITNSLKVSGIDTIGKLAATPNEELVKLKNLGAKSLVDIEAKLKEKGLKKK